MEPALRQQVVDQGLQDSVVFMGHVEEDEKFKILQACDLYVSLSQHEGFGLVFLEAMACGLPVVCYDNDGPTDFLSSQKTGYLIPLNDQTGFIENCKILIEQHDLRKEMGNFNKEKVNEYYIDQCALRYGRVYQHVIGGNTMEKAS